MNGALNVLDGFLIFLSFIVVTVFFMVLKKVYFRLRYKKRAYIFPRISIKGISNIAMVISIAVTILLLLTVLSAGVLGIIFRAYPGWRISIEGVLIKIGGLLFGPIIGIFIGAATDLLSIALTAGVFHYGYFITAILFGLLSGFARTLLSLSRDKIVNFSFMATILSALLFITVIIFILYGTKGRPYSITFGITINILPWVMSLIMGCALGLILVIIWMCLWFWYRADVIYAYYSFTYYLKFKLHINSLKHKLKNSSCAQSVVEKELDWINATGKLINDERNKLNDKLTSLKITKRKRNWINYLIPVAFAIVFSEALINVFIVPEIDATLSLSYNIWLTVRSLSLVVIIPFNIIVIYPVYRIVSPIMKYNYTNDMIESISIPLMME